MLALLTALLRLGRTVRSRREIRALADLEPNLLRDIGLRRSDVRAALAQPFHRDPSGSLNAACCQDHGVAGRVGGAPEPLPYC